MEAANRSISGTVALAKIAPGSKSERVGIVLRTASGEEFALRRLGGNAFQDDALDKLVGTRITARGRLLDNAFIITDWTVER
jgi:hypothetical protein